MTHLIRDWMTPNPITINGDNTLSVAYNLMRINSVRHLPVINDNEKLVGVLTWGDVREARPKASGSDGQNAEWESHFLAAIRDVSEFMTPTPQTASASMPIAEAARLMMDQKIGCLPIVENGHIIGIVTEFDLYRYIVETSANVEATPADVSEDMETWDTSARTTTNHSEPDNGDPGSDNVYPWIVKPQIEAANA